MHRRPPSSRRRARSSSARRSARTSSARSSWPRSSSRPTGMPNAGRSRTCPTWSSPIAGIGSFWCAWFDSQGAHVVFHGANRGGRADRPAGGTARAPHRWASGVGRCHALRPDAGGPRRRGPSPSDERLGGSRLTSHRSIAGALAFAAILVVGCSASPPTEDTCRGHPARTGDRRSSRAWSMATPSGSSSTAASSTPRPSRAARRSSAAAAPRRGSRNLEGRKVQLEFDVERLDRCSTRSSSRTASRRSRRSRRT